MLARRWAHRDAVRSHDPHTPPPRAAEPVGHHNRPVANRILGESKKGVLGKLRGTDMLDQAFLLVLAPRLAQHSPSTFSLSMITGISPVTVLYMAVVPIAARFCEARASYSLRSDGGPDDADPYLPSPGGPEVAGIVHATTSIAAIRPMRG